MIFASAARLFIFILSRCQSASTSRPRLLHTHRSNPAPSSTLQNVPPPVVLSMSITDNTALDTVIVNNAKLIEDMAAKDPNSEDLKELKEMQAKYLAQRETLRKDALEALK
ncbi:hypothetical protein B7494_g7734 [Chlorociboria aeruginascens]|nr:hypothetical protein B7494_g7734 [Chlorociboria aeruginascens]